MVLMVGGPEKSQMGLCVMWGYMGGLYRDTGKQNGSYYLGFSQEDFPDHVGFYKPGVLWLQAEHQKSRVKTPNCLQ